MNTSLAAKLVVIVTITFSLAVLAGAQICGSPGCLDGTFGTGGTAATYVPAAKPLTPAKNAVQSDGKILALTLVLPGDTFSNAITRYNPDGTVDPTFGNGGTIILSWTASTGMARASAIAVQTVGTQERIVVAGTGTGYTSNLRVDRFLPDGSSDTSFGSGGTVSIGAGSAETMAIQSDGKILTMGTAGALVRLNANGSLDGTFGRGGVSQNNTWRVQSIALQADGRIVGAGYWTDVKGTVFGSVWRFNTNGSLDDGKSGDSTRSDSFGKGGQTIIDSFNAAWDVKIDSSGRSVIGASVGSGNTDFAVARLTTAGQLDPSFGAGGKTTVDFSGQGDQVRSVVLPSNGKIILVGFTNNSNGADQGLVRLNANGSVDTTFGQGGKVTSDFSSEGQSTGKALIQFDQTCGCEKLVTTGTVITGGIYYVMAARYIL